MTIMQLVSLSATILELAIKWSLMVYAAMACAKYAGVTVWWLV